MTDSVTPPTSHAADEATGAGAAEATGADAAEHTGADAEQALGRHGSGSLYGWLWRHLPGNRVTRVVLLVVAAAAVVVLLFGLVFPWLEPRLPFNQVTVGGG